MEEVKKAYADMILNAAKEAAALVMAAERRSWRLKKNLVSTKEAAAQLLLRLKQMMDSKATESENILLNQQAKRLELESQLNEVEGIVLNLREELYKARSQLSKSRNKKPPSTESHRDEEMTQSEAAATRELLTLSGSIPDVGLNKNDDELALHLSGSSVGLADEQFVSEEIADPAPSINAANAEAVEALGNVSSQEVMKMEEGSSPVHQKRKLEFSDEAIALCGPEHYSHESKRHRQVSYSGSSEEAQAGEDDQSKAETRKNADGPKSEERVISMDSAPERSSSGLKGVPVKHDEISSSSIECTTGVASESGEGGDNTCPFSRRIEEEEEEGVSFGENDHSGVQDSSTIQLEQIAEQLISLSGGSSIAATASDAAKI